MCDHVQLLTKLSGGTCRAFVRMTTPRKIRCSADKNLVCRLRRVSADGVGTRSTHIVRRVETPWGGFRLLLLTARASRMNDN